MDALRNIHGSTAYMGDTSGQGTFDGSMQELLHNVYYILGIPKATEEESKALYNSY